MKKMTERAMLDAFAGESMAHIKYLAYADVAEREGYKNLARLFRAIAYAEQVHAINHARNLGLIQKSAENVKSGVEGEHFEINEMYPAYDAVARLQDEKGALRSIFYALEAEKIHEKIYREALEDISQGKDIELEDVYICPVCGYTHIGKPEEKCPICNVPPEQFKVFTA